MSDASSPAPPVIPGFEIHEMLGKGGMAEVWKAVQTSLGRPVAIKVMAPKLAEDPQFGARFDREARSLAALNHPNVVSIFDRGHAGDRHYFAMEFVEGESLREIMTRQEGCLPPERTLGLLTQVAEALAYIHEKGTIHRDLKPANIMVTEGDRVKLADFGLASMAEEKAQGQKLTATNVAMGTVHFMSPEQALDAHNVDHRSDLYSFGVILYECLTGGFPLGNWKPVCELDPRLSPDLDRFLSGCLAYLPAERYEHTSELLEDMRSLAAGQTPRNAPAAPPPSLAHNDLSPRVWSQKDQVLSNLEGLDLDPEVSEVGVEAGPAVSAVQDTVVHHPPRSGSEGPGDTPRTPTPQASAPEAEKKEPQPWVDASPAVPAPQPALAHRETVIGPSQVARPGPEPAQRPAPPPLPGPPPAAPPADAAPGLGPEPAPVPPAPAPPPGDAPPPPPEPETGSAPAPAPPGKPAPADPAGPGTPVPTPEAPPPAAPPAPPPGTGATTPADPGEIPGGLPAKPPEPLTVGGIPIRDPRRTGLQLGGGLLLMLFLVFQLASARRGPVPEDEPPRASPPPAAARPSPSPSPAPTPPTPPEVVPEPEPPSSSNPSEPPSEAARLDASDRKAIQAALTSDAPSRVKQALDLETFGEIRYKSSYLGRLLWRTGNSSVASMLLTHLDERGDDPAVNLALIRQVRLRGPEWKEAQRLLDRRGVLLDTLHPEDETILRQALRNDPTDPEVEKAILQLPLMEGAKASGVLKKMCRSAHRSLREAARSGWRRRWEQGLLDKP